jgi:hypothetical protein
MGWVVATALLATLGTETKGDAQKRIIPSTASLKETAISESRRFLSSSSRPLRAWMGKLCAYLSWIATAELGMSLSGSTKSRLFDMAACWGDPEHATQLTGHLPSSDE